MKMNKIIVAVLLMALVSFAVLTACNNPPETSSATTETSTSTETSVSTSTEEPYTFPENGVLKLLTNGEAPGAPDGRNPSVSGSKLIMYFDYAFRNVGLDLEDGTEITYKLQKSDRTVINGTANLDSSVANIKNEYGYIGVCFDMGYELGKYDFAMFEISFKDKAGKEYSVKNRVTKGVAYYGVTVASFDEYLKKQGITTTIETNTIRQSGNINGTDFNFIITLSKWSGKTTPEQIVIVSRLFWQCYPRMYARFGAAGQSPTKVTLDIEDGGYEIASASGNQVHIHDQWLQNNPRDYDCLTHEFAHVIQNGWNGDKCEYSGYIERFADCCRYLYAFEDGEYNDTNWELNTISGESTRETSVRFLVWLDYTYSTDDNDILVKYFDVCRNRNYSSSRWNQAWAEIFEGSELEGKSIETVWNEYAKSEFATLSSKSVFGMSKLLNKYDIRGRLK